MIHFCVGFVVGALCALMAAFYIRHGKDIDAEETSEESRLKTREEQEEARRLAEQKRQFNNILAYTGREKK